MRGFTSLPRPLLVALAVLFAATTILYSVIWVYYAGLERTPDLGIHFGYGEPPPYSLHISEVQPGSAAERAGLRPNDRIVAINGHELDNLNPFYDAVHSGQPGDVVELTVERPGVGGPLTLEAVLPPVPALPLAERVRFELVRFYPVLFVLVGLVVLFLRVQDRNAWLLALMLAGLGAAAPNFQIAFAVRSLLSAFAAFYAVAFSLLLPAIFYFFFAVFPVASPLDRRLPWLKWLLLVAGIVLAVPLGLLAVQMGNAFLLHVLGRASPGGVGDVLLLAFPVYFIGGFGLGVASLLGNSLRAPTPEARRKIRVIVWGTMVGLGLSLLLLARGFSISFEERRLHLSVSTFTFLPLLLIPLAFAYAVVKHRVLEIPVLLKRSAR